jgi:hypothetical protein
MPASEELRVADEIPSSRHNEESFADPGPTFTALGR